MKQNWLEDTILLTKKAQKRWIQTILQKTIQTILRKFRGDGYKQPEIDYMFNSIVMPNIQYGLSVCGAAGAELTTVQCFLARCKK